MGRKRGDDVIDAFVAHLAQHGHPGLKVDARPDEINRNTQDIDAIAGPFAIEHTSVEALHESRAKNPQWEKAVGGLEDEVQGCVSAHLSIATRYDAVTIGQDWVAIRSALKTWICEKADQIDEGRSEIVIDGVPFPVIIGKRNDLPAGVYFSRLVDENSETLSASSASLIERKAQKLAPYQRQKKTTILLLESDDIAMMNHIKMHDAISEGFPRGWPGGIDQIWYANTSLWPAAHFHDMKALAEEIGSSACAS